MSDILINKIVCHIDRNQIREKYDIFKIETSGKKFSKGVRIIDSTLLENDVLAVLFDSGRMFRVLMKHCDSFVNKQKLKRVIADTEDAKFVTIQQDDCERIDDYVLLQLLMNSLGSYSTNALKFNNLTGHVYAFDKSGMSYSKIKGQEFVAQIHTLEFRISKDMIFNFDVRTFTSVLLKNRIDFSKKRFEEYPQYTLGGKYCTMKRKLSESKEPSFIMRQIRNEKFSHEFLDIQSNEKFEKSKMGILTKVFRAFNDNMKGVVELSFYNIANYTSVDFDKKIKDENNSRVVEILNEKQIRLIDTIGLERSNILLNNIVEILDRKYGVNPKVSKRMSKDDLNIRIIHNADYYTNNDPHNEENKGYAIQHITLEDFGLDAEFAVKTVMNELVIKNDLQNGVISIDEWSRFGFDKDLTFGYKYESDSIDRFFFMTIHPNGSFHIRESQNDLFNSTEYHKCLEIFSLDNEVKGTIEDSEGNINIIKDTGIRTIPQIFDLSNELTKGNTKLRGKEKREELLSSCLDIKYYSDSGDYYYFVGTIGAGMRTNVENAVNVRKISSYENSVIFFDKLLPLMNVTFVHNGQLTVVPFPFKYLREYVKKELNLLGKK